MLLFGFGDGGGGPTAEMLERIRRLAGSAAAAPSGGSAGGGGASREVPSVTIAGPTEFFKDLEANARDLLTW